MRFREEFTSVTGMATAGPLPMSAIREVVGATIQPAHFFVIKPLALEWQHAASEEIPWEIYRGRLLDAAQTRLRQTFESWNVFGVESEGQTAEPILSVKLDAIHRELHIVRAVYCFTWEGYHAGNNVYESRETCKWIRELIGTIALDDCLSADELRDEVVALLLQAVVGGSRLPLQSVEAPLPAFSLGQLAYVYRTLAEPGSPPMRSFAELIDKGLQGDLAWLEKAKLLECVLRSTAPHDLGPAAERFMQRWRTVGHTIADFVRLCRTVFNEVALSPYTGFVDNMLVFLQSLRSRGELSHGAVADFLGYLLRQTVRHLTAYDLITFHHRGANYPDALLLDAVLKAVLALIEEQPELFLDAGAGENSARAKRLRRRGLRQAWLLRRSLEGLPVPEVPTSPGENARVLPPPYPRIREEEILYPDRRTKRLFAADPLCFPGARSRLAMQQALDDLCYAEEVRELGMAIFLDRPLGVYKAPAEPDGTLLLSYEMFSRSIAQRRLQLLADDSTLDPGPRAWGAYQEHLRADFPMRGIPITSARRPQKPGVVALEDTAKVADDFIVLRTTRQAVQAFLDQFDTTTLTDRCALDYLTADKHVLIVRACAIRSAAEGILDIVDANWQRRLELQIDPSQGYRRRAEGETPTAGLRVLGAWDAEGSAIDLGKSGLPAETIRLPPRK